MAASVTPSDFAVYVVPPATATNSRFLDRCIEDLSPTKIADCAKKAWKWNAISVICVVAFFALAIGGFIAASLLAPVWVPPVVAIGSLLLAMPATSKVKEFLEWAESAQGEAEKHKEIQRNFADLSGQPSESIQNILRQQGIFTPGSENLDRLKPLLAQSRYFENRTKVLMDLREDCDYTTMTFPPNLGKFYEYEGIHCKIQNAFINAVLRNPEFRGTLETLGTLSKLEVNKSEVKVPQEIITFKNRNITPISYEDAKSQSVAELGQRIFAAMAA